MITYFSLIYVTMIKYFLNKMDFNLLFYPYSNQILWMYQYLKYQNLIALDHNCFIFCTLGDVNVNEKTDVVSINNNRLYNNITKTEPCHIHFNGKSKCFLTKKMIKFLF